jgi:hypothetical protein
MNNYSIFKAGNTMQKSKFVLVIFLTFLCCEKSVNNSPITGKQLNCEEKTDVICTQKQCLFGEIYNSDRIKIVELPMVSTNDDSLSIAWNGTLNDSSKAPPGLYYVKYYSYDSTGWETTCSGATIHAITPAIKYS